MTARRQQPGAEDGMKIIRDAGNAGDRVIALGTFDGVHLGHQALLAAGKSYAREHGALLRACSFDRHPLEVLRPAAAPKLLTTLQEKTELMDRCGVDELQLIPFTRETAGMEPEEFLRMLRETVCVKALVAGWNYTFGKGGRGNADMLREDGEKNGYSVMIVPPVMAGGEAVSSTLIRKSLKEGRILEAGEFLGHPYELRGAVTETGTGTTPARVDPGERKQLPASGVYPCRMVTESGTRAAVATISDGTESSRQEVFIDVPEGADGLQGQEIRLIPGDRLHAPRDSGSPEETEARAAEDRRQAMAFLEAARGE